MSGSLNSLRGAVPFTADGADYILRLTTNAQVRYQDAAKETARAGMKAVLAALEGDDFDLGRMRRLFAAGLSHMAGMTDDRAGDLMDAVGPAEAMRLLLEAFTASMPKSAEGDAGNAPGATPPPPTTATS